MSEYWKSTPKYWCKHCGIYVRDTKLERSNHESTAKHQGSLKRFLRDLHRGHEREENEKERARREVERLNGVISGTPSTSTFSRQNAAASNASSATPAQRKQQIEQLAEMGVSIPTEFLGDMALAGEWTVTATRVVEDDVPEESGSKDDAPFDAKATGVRKRDKTEEEKDEEDAVRGLFKRPRKWGRDTKALPEEDDKELDALLGSSILPLKKEEVDEDKVKKEPVGDDESISHTIGDATAAGDDEEGPHGGPEDGPKQERLLTAESHVKADDDPSGPSPVVFKKRKPKNLRQK
jgi:hypothetical protein